MDKKKICIVGLGRVGLPLALYFAKSGFRVSGVDNNRNLLEKIENRNIHFLDNFLSENLDQIMDSGNFSCSSNPEQAVKSSDVIILALPTPVNSEKIPDLSILNKCAEKIGSFLREGQTVVLESTVYPGYTEEVLIPILEKESGLKAGRDFGAGFSPERINPGDENHTLPKITKIVSGTDRKTVEMLAETYSRIIKDIFVASSIKTAEMAKIIENTQRDVNIALMNEFALMFEKLGIDGDEVLEAAASKWNFNRYYPAPVGGHCIPVDPYYLKWKAEKEGQKMPLLEISRKVNNRVPEHIAEKTVSLLKETGKNVSRSRICVLGLAYKKNVADTRESPSMELIKHLESKGISVSSYDPFVKRESFEKCAEDSDVLILMTDHDEFSKIDLNAAKKLMKSKPIIIDARRMLDPKNVKSKGFIYYGYGRGK